MSTKKRSIFDGLLFCFVFFTIVRAASGDTSHDVKLMQHQIDLANAKIAVLATDQQKAIDTINGLQSSLHETLQEVGQVVSRGQSELDQVDEPPAVQQRTANGHGR